MQELYTRLEQYYDEIYLNVPIYSKRKRLIGEIDILAKKEKTIDVFEVKCSHRITKAKKQLHRIKKNIYKSQLAKGYALGKLFFFCGLTGELVLL